ncbi:MAG: molybdenum cofactor biosynthesis protein MoaE [Chromatiales bacterium]|nr:molybdenum cofactor biosynthesis protein MoaE [Chromatiales bacterium]
MIRIQREDFDPGAEIDRLRGARTDLGAVTSFVGYVRSDDGVERMALEHYPGMTEAALAGIVATAHQRFEFADALVIHRVGELNPGERIVLVAVTGRHRTQTLRACEFIIDYLKTDAPFWKKEFTRDGERWVDARRSDQTKRDDW